MTKINLVISNLGRIFNDVTQVGQPLVGIALWVEELLY